MGLSSLYLRGYSRFEDAITLIQASSAGGAMADNSTELLVKAAITELQDIELRLKNLRIQAHVKKAGSDNIEIDPARGAFLLRSEGRRFIATIANTIGCIPGGDFFSGSVGEPDFSQSSRVF